MARNGSGGYSLPVNSWNPAVNGVLATAADWQALVNDIATAIQQSVSADGQTPMTGNLQMGGNKITGLTVPSGSGNALRWEQLVKGANIASAASLTIPVEGSYFEITGTTTISGFADTYNGRIVYLKFTGILTLTNSSSFVLPNGNITTKAGDIGVFVNDVAGVWRCIYYPTPLNLDSPGVIGGVTPNVGNFTSVNSKNTFGFKNRIINGDMRIDQRNAGASVTPSTSGNTYCVDRWTWGVTQASKLTAQQSSTAPSGFTKSLLVTSSSAYSVASGDVFGLFQRIEGLNVADLAWGTASATTVALSFLVRSSLTGTFGGSLQNGTATRSYPFTFTINSANTWEQKTVTIAGDTSGTWATDNGVGLQLTFSMGAGSTYSGTADAWASGNYYSATGATSVVGTNGATFYITGVQLEVGSTATSFDVRDYGRELILCKRYYQKGNQGLVLNVSAYSSVNFGIDMRASPTVNVVANSGTAGGIATSIDGFYVNCTTTSACSWTASAEL